MFKNIIDLFKPCSKKQTELNTKQKEGEFYRELEIDVLARTIFGEARGEPVEGLEAVASVVLNRIKISQKKGRYWCVSKTISV